MSLSSAPHFYAGLMFIKSQKISPRSLSRGAVGRENPEKKEDIIKNRARHEIRELKQMLCAINEYLKHAPEGGLKIQQRMGNTYYYHQQKSDETGTHIKHYISKKDEKLAKTLAQKGYYTKVKPVLEQNLHALEEFMNIYDEDAIDRVYDTLIDARKNLVNPIKVH